MRHQDTIASFFVASTVKHGLLWELFSQQHRLLILIMSSRVTEVDLLPFTWSVPSHFEDL